MYLRFYERNGLDPIRKTVHEFYDILLTRDEDAAVNWVDVYLRRVIEGPQSIIEAQE